MAVVGVAGFAVVAPTAAADHTLHVPVLMYHRIAPAPRDARLPQLWVPPRLFRAQLRRLAERGWRTITAEELARAVLSGRTVGPKRFVITIDDGARDGHTHAAPIMAALGMRATFCVVPGRTGLPWQLTETQLVRLHASGHEIANHSLRHADLQALGSVALRRQVALAARRIDRFVGEPPATLCYPYGRHDARAHRVVAQTGHLAAFTTVDAVAQARATRFRWPRLRVSASTSPSELLGRLRPFARGGGAEPRKFIPALGITGDRDWLADHSSMAWRQVGSDAPAGEAPSQNAASMRGTSSEPPTALVAAAPATPVTPVGTSSLRRDGRAGARAGATSTKPNIVILMLDDVGADDGRLWRHLPAIRERFLDDGLAFTDFHGETPDLLPRAGRFPDRAAHACPRRDSQ